MVKRVMLVMPGRLYRDGIELVLRGTGVEIVSNCESVERAEMALLAQPALSPDLFVVGMDLPERTVEDFARIRGLRATLPDARWIVLSSFGSPEFWWQAVESRVDGVLHQESPGEVLQLLVRLILLGYSFLPASLAPAALAPFSATAGLDRGSLEGGAGMPETKPNDVVAGPSSLPDRAISDMFKLPDRSVAPVVESASRVRAGLSERESQILRGLVAGLPNKLIARDLHISEATVKVHVKALLRKMQVTNRTQAAISALQFLDRTGREQEARPPMAGPAATVDAH